MHKINIIIADGHFLSRKGLAVLLNTNSDLKVLSEALSTSDLINQSLLYQPNLIIIDYTSANYSLESLRQIIKKYPTTHLLAITDNQNRAIISKALNMGITSHLLKDCEQDEIMEAIYKTAQGKKFMCSKIVTDILYESSEETSRYSCKGLNISEREMEIIKLIAEGCSNKEVADKLFLSNHTITTHRKNIMNKLGVNNTAGLVLFAVRENLVSPNHFLFSAAN